MKHPLPSALILCATIFLLRCTNADPPPNTVAILPAFIQKDSVSLDTYNLWKSNWQSDSRTWINTDTLISFEMPLVDFKEVIAEGAVKSRFYLGLEGNAKDGFTAKLMVVGIDSNGYDMIDYSKGEYVYDLSQACPPFCAK